MAPTSWTIIDRAHEALRTAVRGVGADQWTAATPCSEWSVAQVFQHALGDQQAYGAALTGAGFPAEDPFAPSGTLAGDPAGLLEPALAGTVAAYADVAVDDPAVDVPLPQGPLAAPTAAAAAALDAAVHAWDIAVATGQEPLLDDTLARDLLAVAPEIVEPVRAFAFAPALTGDDDGSAVAELLRYVGRDPAWTPGG
jgi:uncharacterized protein (TIGR03086 family)